jgi:hypothetical protein
VSSISLHGEQMLVILSEPVLMFVIFYAMNKYYEGCNPAYRISSGHERHMSIPLRTSRCLRRLQRHVYIGEIGCSSRLSVCIL